MINTKIPLHHFSSVLDRIEVGEQTAIDHKDCPAGRDTRQRLFIKRVDTGYVAYCHNCGGTGFKFFKSDVRSVDEVMSGLRTAFGTREQDKRIEEAQTSSETIADLDLVDEIPIRERVWLYQYHMTDEMITTFKIKFSKKYEMIAIPISYGLCQDPIGYQLRNLGTAYKWKYKTIAFEKTTRKFDFMPWVSNPTLTSGFSDYIVLTEDLLSSYRVAHASDASCAMVLMGTHVDDKLLAYLRETPVGIVVWLDPDVAGIKAAADISRQLAASVDKLAVIHDPQPKELDDAKIQEILTRASSSW